MRISKATKSHKDSSVWIATILAFAESRNDGIGADSHSPNGLYNDDSLTLSLRESKATEAIHFYKTAESTKISSDFIESTKDSIIWIKASCNDEKGKIPHKTPNSRNDNSIADSSDGFA